MPQMQKPFYFSINLIGAAIQFAPRSPHGPQQPEGAIRQGEAEAGQNPGAEGEGVPAAR